MRYCDSKVWLRVTGGGVVGWDLIEINAKIDEFNVFPWADEADFFSGCHGMRTMEMIIKDFLHYGTAD